MLAKIVKLCEQSRARVVGLRAAEVSELRKKIDSLTDEEEVINLELLPMHDLVEEAAKLQSEVAELREAVAEDEANVSLMSGLWNKV